MKFIIKQICDKTLKQEISREVLNDLPEWFGLPDSTEEYISASRDKPFLACFHDSEVVGFTVLNATSTNCAEIFVMGVKKKFHRKGAGKLLTEAYEAMAKGKGYIYSQVKTVETGHYKGYDITNNFYRSMGYKELEVFPTLWNEWNPCQIYIKYLA